jgi:hypothetical protein
MLHQKVVECLFPDAINNRTDRKNSNLSSLKILSVHVLLAIIAMRYARKQDRSDARSETKTETTDN